MAATKLGAGDTVISVMPVQDQNMIVLQTREGFFLKFSLEEIPEQKKAALGARGMKLGAKDAVEQVYYIRNAGECLIEYKGKQLSLNKLKTAKRDGKGTKVKIQA